MNLVKESNIFNGKSKTENLNYLETRFDQLYSQALILKNNPQSSEYIEIKAELKSIYKKIDGIVRN